MRAAELMIQAFADTHPEEIARELERVADEEAVALLQDLQARLAARVLREMVPTAATRCFERLTPDFAARLSEELDLERAHTLLRRAEAGARQSILAALGNRRRARALTDLLAHEAGTAGALMDPLVLGVPETVTVNEALERVRRAPANSMYYVYVLGIGGELRGVVNQRELMLAPGEARVRSVMTSEPERLMAQAGALAIVTHPAWQRVHALPVVDRNDVFLGAIRYERARRIERELGQGTRSGDPDAAARALAEFFGIGLSALSEWAAASMRDQDARSRAGGRT